MTVIGIAIAGAIGAPARYLVDRYAGGTFVVNVSGSLLLGLIAGAAMYHGLHDTPRLVLGTGFCGAYTTFSTAMWETVDGGGARYLAASTIAGTAAAALGLLAAALIG